MVLTENKKIPAFHKKLPEASIASAVVASIEEKLTGLEQLVNARSRNMVELAKLRRIADANRIAYEEFLKVATESAQLKALQQPSVRLLKHIIRCYLRLSDNPRARECLRQCFPDQLRDPNFTACLKDDIATQKWLVQLLMQLGYTQ